MRVLGAEGWVLRGWAPVRDPEAWSQPVWASDGSCLCLLTRGVGTPNYRLTLFSHRRLDKISEVDVPGEWVYYRPSMSLDARTGMLALGGCKRTHILDVATGSLLYQIRQHCDVQALSWAPGYSAHFMVRHLAVATHGEVATYVVPQIPATWEWSRKRTWSPLYHAHNFPMRDTTDAGHWACTGVAGWSPDGELLAWVGCTGRDGPSAWVWSRNWDPRVPDTVRCDVPEGARELGWSPDGTAFHVAGRPRVGFPWLAEVRVRDLLDPQLEDPPGYCASVVPLPDLLSETSAVGRPAWSLGHSGLAVGGRNGVVELHSHDGQQRLGSLPTLSERQWSLPARVAASPVRPEVAVAYGDTLYLWAQRHDPGTCIAHGDLLLDLECGGG